MVDILAASDDGLAFRAHFPRDNRVIVKVGVLGRELAQTVVVEQIGRVRRAQHQMDLAGATLPTVGGGGTCGWTVEQLHQKPAEGRDAGSGREKKVVVLRRVRRQQETLAVWPRDIDRVAGLAIAKPVGAGAEEQRVVVRVVGRSLRLALGDQALGRGGDDAAETVLAPTRARQRIEADFVRLSVLVGARSHDAETLPGSERSFERRAADIDLNMTDERRALALGAQPRRVHFRCGGRVGHHHMHLGFGEDRFRHGRRL